MIERDLISATGLEKGGIYNHFGSKEQLAMEAYDFAMSRVTNALARSQDDATDAVDRLTRMIRAFGTFARKPAIASSRSGRALRYWFSFKSGPITITERAE